MESKNAQFLRQGLIETYRKMTPVQRVRAFIRHSRMVKQIHAAGERRRKSEAEKRSPDGR
ncbi:MAG: hypothetical protein ABIW76_12145 [Fibrobacteria bacterium]